MQGCWEPNLKLREAERMFEDQIIGPESIANIGGSASVSRFSFISDCPVKTDICLLFVSADVFFSGTADGKIVKLVGRRLHTVARLGKLPCGEKENMNLLILLD